MKMLTFNLHRAFRVFIPRLHPLPQFIFVAPDIYLYVHTAALPGHLSCGTQSVRLTMAISSSVAEHNYGLVGLNQHCFATTFPPAAPYHAGGSSLLTQQRLKDRYTLRFLIPVLLSIFGQSGGCWTNEIDSGTK